MQPIQINVQPSTSVVVNPAATNTIATAGFVLAIIALCFCWLPYINFLIVPVAIIGLLCGFFGFFIGLCKGGAGLAVSLLAMLFAGAALYVFYAVMLPIVLPEVAAWPAFSA